MAKISSFFRSLPFFFASIRDYFGKNNAARRIAITDSRGVAHFLQTRSSHVGQTSLYGYIRTRAGTRYPDLFENDDYVVSINIAKWQVWIACLSDLSLYAGGLISARTGATADEVRTVIETAAVSALDEIGDPDDAGDQFAVSRERLLERIKCADWRKIGDDNSAFSESPVALVKWAPIIDTLKDLDSEIVQNSVRFRWHEVRRDLRRDLDAEAVIASLSAD